ncbi:nucleoside diphosphate kinase [Parasteatoda tepidariorum]|uniref:nucleoside diphosphate kinase n=1 Tax=Parasteatoda tepidariorum TaxID=114398 RepID=UPI001C7251A0|nr:nucleoside diphosphate kinase-like [Parasteatoda tepidariorum]
MSFKIRLFLQCYCITFTSLSSLCSSVASQYCPIKVTTESCTDSLVCAMAHRERTFVMIKPDGVQRGLIGKIISRFENKGFKLVGMKFVQASQTLLEQHYAELAGRPFFPGLVNYMQLGPVVPMVWEGLNIVKTARDIIGATNPMESAPGTIRGDLCVQVGRNIIHGSDSLPSAEREISLWFTEDELTNYSQAMDSWIYEEN